jgi:hypothetical protein
MARDNRLLLSFPTLGASAKVLQTATTGVVTMSGAADTWAKGTSTPLNLGGFNFYAAASGPVPPATETAGSGSVVLNGNMGAEAYVQFTLATSLTLNSAIVTVMVEGASDSSGSAGTDWAPISGGYVCPASLSAKRINLQLIDTPKPWIRITVLVTHAATTAGTGTVTITNAGYSIGRDGVPTAG